MSDSGWRADRLRLRQILTNLLSNAVKFTPERGRIFISARRLGGTVPHGRKRQRRGVVVVQDGVIEVEEDRRDRLRHVGSFAAAVSLRIRVATALSSVAAVASSFLASAS